MTVKTSRRRELEQKTRLEGWKQAVKLTLERPAPPE